MAALATRPATRRFYSIFAQWHRLSVCPHRTRHEPSWAQLRPNFLRELHSTSCKHAPLSEQEQEQSLAEHTRRLMRRIPHSVAVLTTSKPDSTTSISGDTETGFRAMTVSSLATVTLSPSPVISFNIKLPSATYDALRANDGRFLVHFLSATPGAARIADAFTRGNANITTLLRELTRPAESVKDGVKIYSGAGTAGAPLLVGDGIMKVFRCKLLPREMEVGDHVLLLADVLGIVGPVAYEDVHAAQGLCYVDGGYHSIVKEKITVPRSKQPHVKAHREDEPVLRTVGLNLRRGDEVYIDK